MQWKFMHTIVLIQDGCQLQEVMSLCCIHSTTYNWENIKLQFGCIILLWVIPEVVIFASQGLRFALFIFTLGIVSRIFVIPAPCHLLDFDSCTPCNDVIFSQSTRGFHFLSFEYPENWLEIIIWLIFKRRFDEAHTVIQW